LSYFGSPHWGRVYLGSFSSNPNPDLRFSFTDAPSLCYNFTITPNGQPWCEVQGQVDEKIFLFHECGSKKVVPMSLLREDVNATKVWNEQIDTLCHVGDLLKQQLPDIKLEKYTDIPLTLQARMTCECKANGRTSASWEFSFNGQRYLLFDSKTRKYTVGHPGGKQIKENWEHDKELMAHFTKISLGDCQEWLPALVHWEKQVDTTGKREGRDEVVVVLR
uniref:MHC class I-like antigen recognition-like domain-containing protein n=1 Tax=Rhinolophus ferrumequinum TaxID=59479 RepID=A0A671FEV8_RHIFE